MDVESVILRRVPLHRSGPQDPARILRQDAVLAAAVLALCVCLVLVAPDDGRRPTAVGWALLLAAHVPAVWRRSAPMPAFIGGVLCVAPYHALDFQHSAPVPVSMVLMFTVAATGRVLRSVLIGMVIIGMLGGIKFAQGMTEGEQMLRIAGWLATVVLLGVCTRVNQQYLASAIERAERAERICEEEVRRRGAEERLCIARDLHDVLAHSITLIGVQTSVAAHVLKANPDRLDHADVAKTLDEIADTCRSARLELRSALQVLRSETSETRELLETRGPLPGLDGVRDLAAAARNTGVAVVVGIGQTRMQVPPAVGACAYRIVQEALTNAVRHGGPGITVQVRVLENEAGALEVAVTDDGRAAPQGPSAPSGFGLIGLRERARSVRGTLRAGPGECGGFEVQATLPLGAAPPARPVTEAAHLRVQEPPAPRRRLSPEGAR